MKINEIKKEFGVVYNSDNEIVSVKTPGNTVYPASDSEVFECETEEELNGFIIENKLEYLKGRYGYLK